MLPADEAVNDEVAKQDSPERMNTRVMGDFANAGGKKGRKVLRHKKDQEGKEGQQTFEQESQARPSQWEFSNHIP